MHCRDDVGGGRRGSCGGVLPSAWTSLFRQGPVRFRDQFGEHMVVLYF
jgi:hypothetical protein